MTAIADPSAAVSRFGGGPAHASTSRRHPPSSSSRFTGRPSTTTWIRSSACSWEINRWNVAGRLLALLAGHQQRVHRRHPEDPHERALAGDHQTGPIDGLHAQQLARLLQLLVLAP